jgi:hypothetical protein
MGLCAGVFDEEQLTLGLRLPGSAEEGNEDAEAAAIECSADDATPGYRFDDAKPFSGADGVGLAGQRGEKAGHVDAIFAVKVGGDHGTVEGGKAEVIEQMELNGGEVAVSEKRLWVFANEFEVEAGEQVVGAIAATDGGDERGIWVDECAVEVIEAMAGDSSEE